MGVARAERRHVLARRDPVPVLVEEVDHVGVAEAARQAHQERDLVALHDAANVAFPAVIRGVGPVEDEAAVDVRQQHPVLVHVGDAIDPDPVAERNPRAVLEHAHVVALLDEVVANPVADVIGQEDLLAKQLRQRIRVEVIRMPVRDPDVFRGADRLQLRLGDLVRLPPAAEVRLVREPGIGDEHRPAPVVQDQDGVADGVEAGVHAGVRLKPVPTASESKTSP